MTIICKKGFLFLFFLWTAVFLQQLSAYEWHIGEETVKADLIKVCKADDGSESAALRDGTGRLFCRPVSELSEPDRQFIEDYKNGKKNSNGEPVSESDAQSSGTRGAVLVQGEKVSGKSEKYAILVGVNKYKNLPDRSQLHYCENDMESLGEVLASNGFYPENVFVLTTKEGNLPPTKENIEEQVEKLLSILSENDTVVLAFSGHGVSPDETKGYFCPAEIPPLKQGTRSEDYVQHLVSREWIFGQLKQTKAQKKLFIVDACRDNPFEEAKSGDGTKGIGTQSAFRSLDDQVGKENETSLYLIASCERGKKSREVHNLQHGIFSYYFIEGLKGKADREKSTGGDNNGIVTVKEAFEYAQQKVRENGSSGVLGESLLFHMACENFQLEIIHISESVSHTFNHFNLVV